MDLPGVVTGVGVPANAGAMDVGLQRLVAYAVGSVVVVRDAETLEQSEHASEGVPIPLTGGPQSKRWTATPVT